MSIRRTLTVLCMMAIPVCLIGIGLIETSHKSSAHAQANLMTPTMQSPVGTWRVTIHLKDGTQIQALYTCNSDGNLTETDTTPQTHPMGFGAQQSGHGVWAVVGDGIVGTTYVKFHYDSEGVFTGQTTVSERLFVGSSGKVMGGTFKAITVNRLGDLEREDVGKISGTRLAVLPM